jgi:galactokinase
VRYVNGFLRFWYDFIVGDDWKIAVAVVIAVGAGAVGAVAGLSDSAAFAPLVALAIVAAFVVALLVDIRGKAG